MQDIVRVKVNSVQIITFEKTPSISVHLSTVPWPIGSSRGHDRWLSLILSNYYKKIQDLTQMLSDETPAQNFCMDSLVAWKTLIIYSCLPLQINTNKTELKTNKESNPFCLTHGGRVTHGSSIIRSHALPVIFMNPWHVGVIQKLIVEGDLISWALWVLLLPVVQTSVKDTLSYICQQIVKIN